jgi:general stress protein 26
MMHNDSCHPQEHKYLGIKYLIDRMNTYPIFKENKSREAQYINIILKNNNYQLYTHKHNNKNKENTTNTAQKTKWATFTYTGKETRTITRLFKDTNICIAYTTNNTLKKHLKQKRQAQISITGVEYIT